MDRIRIDLTHALESSLGQGKGIRAAELEECASAAAAALRALSARRASTSAWLDVAAASREHERILEWAEGLRGRFRALVVLNVGGSALAVQALRTALNSPFHNLTMPGGLPRLIVLDNVDPDLVGEFLDCVDPAECLFHVVSHSGSTPATLAQFLLVREVLRERLGEEAHKDRIVVSTREDGGALAAIAAEEGYERFAIPAGISARFAALTPVALLPAALLGIDTPGLVAGAQAMSELCLSEDLSANPALAWAACSVLLATRHAKSIEVTLSYSHRLRDLAPWGAPGRGVPGPGPHAQALARRARARRRSRPSASPTSTRSSRSGSTARATSGSRRSRSSAPTTRSRSRAPSPSTRRSRRSADQLRGALRRRARRHALRAPGRRAAAGRALPRGQRAPARPVLPAAPDRGRAGGRVARPRRRRDERARARAQRERRAAGRRGPRAAPRRGSGLGRARCALRLSEDARLGPRPASRTRDRPGMSDP